MLEFKYRLRSDIPEEEVKFELTIKEWTDKGMLISMDFENPEMVSIGDLFDQAYVKVKNPQLFVSQETG